MTLLQAILIAFIAYLGWIATPWLFGQDIAYLVFGKPLVAGLIVGLIMGDVQNGVIIGATINALYIGLVTPGGAMAADLTFAGYVGTALALSAHVSANMALTIAIPLGLLGTFVWQLFATVNALFAHRADKYAAEGSLGKLTFMTLGVPQIFAFILRFIPAFLVLYYGAGAAQNIVHFIPSWLTSIITVMGGMLPALGMAVLIKMLMSKFTLISYFIIGFIAVALLKFPILTVALIGISLAMVNLMVTNKKGESKNV
ncbi:PTS sugar transporter subunit IIC [Sporolactobacillus sp. CQH2019]|uniref:PTS mannose/fructose/sorbose/N-acetylgalactosamine transporter subunit IIC n=1 Tax=Sporolactobacillus sp. CQH2019 TaxID=3023512 RepID=UPI002367DA4E|nr:PTS sugar transporter subunit IIC [Sporolactobacillus sp. CQH2019]MDD9150278.1 PTS sugar transporter subunit IIC [Sporolactobacillus sp. CQH2019]